MTMIHLYVNNIRRSWLSLYSDLKFYAIYSIYDMMYIFSTYKVHIICIQITKISTLPSLKTFFTTNIIRIFHCPNNHNTFMSYSFLCAYQYLNYRFIIKQPKELPFPLAATKTCFFKCCIYTHIHSSFKYYYGLTGWENIVNGMLERVHKIRFYKLFFSWGLPGLWGEFWGFIMFIKAKIKIVYKKNNEWNNNTVVNDILWSFLKQSKFQCKKV